MSRNKNNRPVTGLIRKLTGGIPTFWDMIRKLTDAIPTLQDIIVRLYDNIPTFK